MEGRTPVVSGLTLTHRAADEKKFPTLCRSAPLGRGQVGMVALRPFARVQRALRESGCVPILERLTHPPADSRAELSQRDNCYLLGRNLCRTNAKEFSSSVRSAIVHPSTFVDVVRADDQENDCFAVQIERRM